MGDDQKKVCMKNTVFRILPWIRKKLPRMKNGRSLRMRTPKAAAAAYAIILMTDAAALMSIAALNVSVKLLEKV